MERGSGKGKVMPGAKEEGAREGQKECRPGRLSSVRPASRAAVTCSPAFAVPSAPRGLTSLFGMGRGGAPVLSRLGLFLFRDAPLRAAPRRSRAIRAGRCVPEGGLPEAKRDPRRHDGVPLAGPVPGPAHPVCSRSSSVPLRFRGGAGTVLFRSLRAISTARLSVSPRLHLRPIDVVVCDGPWMRPYLGPASCLDAFSTYPARTRLPGGAAGATTGSPEVRPARSSRTGAGSPQVSTPTTDRDRTVSRRSEPSSRATLMGEQPNPWDLLQPRDVTSRHRGAKPLRRYELLGGISLLSRSTFYPLSDGPSMRYRRITMPKFPSCSACRPRSRAPLCHCTLRPVANRPEGTFGSLRYAFGGDHPSQTTRQAVSALTAR